MTELQAALGISQLRRLHKFVVERHKLASRYDAVLKDLPVKTPFQLGDTYSGLHLYVIRLELEKISSSHKEVFDYLRSKDIGVNLHYIPVHLQPYYRSMGFKEGDFPESERYYSEAISLPMYPGLSEEDQNKVVDVLEDIVSR
jgi:dTDP-4-amino-4,6-dideoxygalactose transaminase